MKLAKAETLARQGLDWVKSSQSKGPRQSTIKIDARLHLANTQEKGNDLPLIKDFWRGIKT